MTSGKGEADTRPPREFANASFLLVPAAELCKSGMPDSRILELFKRCSVLVVVVLHHVTTVVDGRTIFADVHGCLRGIRLTQWTRSAIGRQHSPGSPRTRIQMHGWIVRYN